MDIHVVRASVHNNTLITAIKEGVDNLKVLTQRGSPKTQLQIEIVSAMIKLAERDLQAHAHRTIVPSGNTKKLRKHIERYKNEFEHQVSLFSTPK
jgi:hypothetical protein